MRLLSANANQGSTNSSGVDDGHAVPRLAIADDDVLFPVAGAGEHSSEDLGFALRHDLFLLLKTDQNGKGI